MRGELVPAVDDSALALHAVAVEPGASVTLREEESDSLVYVASGSGWLDLGGDHPVAVGSAALVLAGEEARVTAETRLELAVASVGPDVDLHAPMGRRETVVMLMRSDADQATSARAFQILFGPHNGSTRATLFAGFIPPGRAPWHYHLYDEIVWVPEGPGRLHLDESATDLDVGSAFRLRPRQVHIVENLSSDEMTIIGVFTPAGSPSAAYLAPDVASDYSAEPVA